jgi:hypothetical protein
VDRTGSIFRIFVLFVSLVRAFLITIQEGAAYESPRMVRMNADERKTDQKSCSYPRPSAQSAVLIRSEWGKE